MNYRLAYAVGFHPSPPLVSVGSGGAKAGWGA
jgi:hypothetical protein